MPVPEVITRGRSDPARASPQGGDDTPVLFTDVQEPGEVVSECAVIEGAVNDSIRLGCSGAERFGVFEISPVDAGAGRGEHSGAVIRACQSEHLMSRAGQFRYDGGANEAGGSGEEYTHVVCSFCWCFAMGHGLA